MQVSIFPIRNQLQYKVNNPGNRANADRDEPLLWSESVAIVYSECLACEGNEYELHDHYSSYNYNEEGISGDSFEDVELFVELASVEEVKDLQHHESVENKGEVT